MEKNHTLDFTHFKLHSDSTLKTFTKDELIDYIKMVHKNWSGCDERLFYVNNVLQECYKSKIELGCYVEVVLKALKQDRIYTGNKTMQVSISLYLDDDGDVAFDGKYKLKDYKQKWWLKPDKSE